MNTKKPPPGDDDLHAFRQAMTGVRPLALKPALPAGPRPRRPTRSGLAARQDALLAARLQTDDPATIDPGGQLLFRRAGVRDVVLRKLKRGQFPLEAEVDLHGMRQHPARDALLQFINDSVERRLQCVRVIHGKGLRSGPDGPVLKIAVSHWLRQIDNVKAFASARPVDGGSGALYVLLR